MDLLNECVAELQKELPPEQMPTITLAMLEKATGGFLHDDLEKIQSLLDQGLQIPQEIEEMSTLGFIAQKHKDNILKYFVEEKKFDVNYQDSEGRSPLIYLLINAIPWGMNMECLSYLLDQKADVNYEDKNGISALQYACLLCREDRVEAIKALIRHGAKYQKLLRKGNPFIIEALKEIKQEKKNLFRKNNFLKKTLLPAGSERKNYRDWVKSGIQISAQSLYIKGIHLPCRE